MATAATPREPDSAARGRLETVWVNQHGLEFQCWREPGDRELMEGKGWFWMDALASEQENPFIRRRVRRARRHGGFVRHNPDGTVAIAIPPRSMWKRSLSGVGSYLALLRRIRPARGRVQLRRRRSARAAARSPGRLADDDPEPARALARFKRPGR